MTHAPNPSAPAAGPWVDAWLSTPRFGVYLAQTGGDYARALALYEWNSRLSCAVLHDLGHFEVALRNAYAAALDATWNGAAHWLVDPASPLRAPLIRTKKSAAGTYQRDMNDKVRKAIDAARWRYGAHAPAGKIIAELSLGTWRYLSSAAHEKTLWVPHLHHAFPAGTNRARTDQKIGNLHELRNRAAHWEPLRAAAIPARMTDLLDVAGLLQPQLAAYIQAHSTVSALLSARP
jgi:hypothetical protein